MGKYAAFTDGAAMSDGPERQPTGDEMAAILGRVAASATSAAGIATALADAVRVLRRCAWVEGELRIELAAAPEGVTVHVFTDQGAVRERALPVVTLAISLDELDVALQGAAGLYSPLRMWHHKGKLIFTQSRIAVTVPPPEIEVAAESLVSELAPNPHEQPTVKQPAYVLPELQRSGTHPRGAVSGGDECDCRGEGEEDDEAARG